MIVQATRKTDGVLFFFGFFTPTGLWKICKHRKHMKTQQGTLVINPYILSDTKPVCIYVWQLNDGQYVD